MGPNIEKSEFGTETNFTNPDLLNRLLESTASKVSVSVQSQLENPRKPIGGVANPNRMFISIERSISTIKSDPFLPGLQIQECVPGKAIELGSLTSSIWTGTTFVNFSYTADFCKKLRAQKRVATQCGCLSDLLPINRTLYDSYPLCRSFKDVINSGFTKQSWLRSRISQLQTQLGSRTCLAYDAFLNNINYYILPQAGLANFLQINIVLQNSGGTKLANDYEYTFDYLLADFGGTLGLWVDWTVIGFFEDLDHFTGSIFVILVTLKNLKMKSGNNKTRNPPQDQASDEHENSSVDLQIESETCTTRC
ncbi:hypothetical protein Ciccas_000893 [Cichlidogyrus casuarinus]|uniref:Uncharacterized protein n=1 Tax=Cichlidogyrus casuarinus TaxID=1844966 RepID=A0ABD2QLY4_9PLAT